MTRRPNLAIVWLVLLAATIATYFVGELGRPGVPAVAFMLALAFVKGRLVIHDFMGLRNVKLFWRGLVIGWLSVVLALIALAYVIGKSGG